VEVENTLDDHITNELAIGFTGKLSGIELFVDLASGSIFQHPFGGNGPPHPALLPVFPELAYDSFVSLDSPVSGGPYGEPLLVGGSVHLGGSSTAYFTTEGINQGWAPSSSVMVSDQSDFMAARVTLSDEAMGTWGVRSGAGGQIRYFFGALLNGRLGFFDLPGDYDADGGVGQSDLDLVLQNWGAPATPAPGSWISNLPAGLVSQDELDPVLINWGSRYMGGDARSIPEPSTVVLLMVAALPLICQGRWTCTLVKR
jgi:hypothetical protein